MARYLLQPCCRGNHRNLPSTVCRQILLGDLPVQHVREKLCASPDDETGKIVRRIPVVVSTSLLKDNQGKILGGVETFRDMSVVEELREELEGRFRVGDIVSRNPEMHKIFRMLPQVSESDSTVLIQGETGTGKELLAKAIHELSPRRAKPFVSINCGALPDTLSESELFGYRKGAFTDAGRDKPGFFTTAEGGTILLDEIGDLSAAFQVRLLRVLQDRTYQPLGATAPLQTNVRIIAATNKLLAVGSDPTPSVQ